MFKFILRNLSFHWRAHLAAGLASAVGTAVLAGALIVGDSVRFSLQTMALERLGSTRVAMQSGERLFRADLAARMAAQPGIAQQFDSIQALFSVEGVCIDDDKGTRAGQVQVHGVTDGFWKLGENGPARGLARGELALNTRLAEKLGVKVGDTLRVRLLKPDVLPRDAPLGSDKPDSAVLRSKVAAILPDKGLGRFSLRANQTVPYNAFLPLADIQEKLGQKERANVLLLGSSAVEQARALSLSNGSPPAGRAAGGQFGLKAAQKALQLAWDLDDAELRVRVEPKMEFIELSTSRVFLDDVLASELLKDGASGIATYFVNRLSASATGLETPYSMVCAANFQQPQLKDDEIVLNEWIAEDLKVKPGDRVEMEYFTAGPMRKLETRKAAFTVKSIIWRNNPVHMPINDLYADRKLMPDFPGIADVDTTHDWDSSMPIDMKKIRPKDEAYWKNYRGTPKAFISLNAGSALWRNRFGTYTALRFPLHGDPAAAREDLARLVREKIEPGRLGFTLMPVRALALAASDQAVDFGQLFLGFSFFLVVSALLLMALVFQFGVQSRAEETGLLLALGFAPGRVRNLLWAEGIFVAAGASICGVPAGILYAQALLGALTTRWHDAVGTRFLDYHAEPASLIVGYVSGVAIAAGVIFFAVRRQAARPARELLAPGGAETAPMRTGRRWMYAGALCFAAALALVAIALSSTHLSSAGTFFGAGSLLLIAALFFERDVLGRQSCRNEGTDKTSNGPWLLLARFGVRACSRRGGRSLATVALLACGAFLVVAVGANQQDASADVSKSSGTGGFALYAQSTLPFYDDLNTPAGRAKAGLPEQGLSEARFYPMRVKAGDEASCLNLNRAQQPRILGVSESFIKRGGFTFVSQLTPGAQDDPWSILHRKDSSAPVPAVCDDQSLTYALGMSLGDELTLSDEHGVAAHVKIVGTLANSVLQGSVLIAEEEFIKLFPSESGYSACLIDAPAGTETELAKVLESKLQDDGFEVTSAWKRLAEFNAVENTYLSTFQALGSLGLLLGSLGLGLVVLRNMLERRSELALLSALGFSRASIGWLVLSEHAWLLLLGLSAGVIPALVAVAPAMHSSSAPIPWASIGGSMLAIMVCGLASALLATWAALRAPLLAALRNE